ncbi:MAG: endonuclease [Candidatus Amoebophilus sp. 36-38]|nr:MAG: endonuclease [Candidatus Amoebophilus sp. 36-38]
MKHPTIYIMASKKNGTIYTGVTSSLIRRAYEHKEALQKGFTKKYGCKLLVYYEFCPNMIVAITREKQLKSGSRKKKIDLIQSINPNWKDLYEELF